MIVCVCIPFDIITYCFVYVGMCILLRGSMSPNPNSCHSPQDMPISQETRCWTKKVTLF